MLIGKGKIRSSDLLNKIKHKDKGSGVRQDIFVTCTLNAGE